MLPNPGQSPTPLPSGRSSQTYLGALVLAILACLAYANSFRVPFLFDDFSAITANPTIQHLNSGVMRPPADTTVDGRPLVNVSLAINYAISGFAPWSYHALNLLIHFTAALFLAGIVRRSARLWWPKSTERSNDLVIGFAAAAIWLLHPLDTEAVTYVVQRAESMMALCFLATLYFFIRGATEEGQERLLNLSLIACYIGMAAKEVMVVAPAVVILYDAMFVGRSFKTAFGSRGRYYCFLCLSWVVLACLVARSPARVSDAKGVGIYVALLYWAVQPVAIVHYLCTVVSPSRLVFDYGLVFEDTKTELIDFAGLAVAALLVMWLVRCRKALGFGLAAAFLILSVTSLVPGNRQTMADQRMYLPLAFLVATLAGHAAQLWSLKKVCIGAAALSLIFGLGTWNRNRDFATARTIWADTVRKVPGNAFAHNNLGAELLKGGDLKAAKDQFNWAFALSPTLAIAWENFGAADLRLGLPQEAAYYFRESIRLNPDNCSEHNGLGVALMRSGDLFGARKEFIRSIEIDPSFKLARENLTTVLIAIWKDHTDQLPGFSGRGTTGAQPTRPPAGPL